MDPMNPLIIQSDMEILLEVANPKYIEARDAIAPFTELVKSPEHLHTYRISHLSLWNAASSGHSTDEIIKRLEDFSKFPIPGPVVTEITEYMGRYGRLKLIKENDQMLLWADEEALMVEVLRVQGLEGCLELTDDPLKAKLDTGMRGHIKMVLTQTGFPVEDLAGYTIGDPLKINLRQDLASSGKPFILRDYQRESAEVFYASGSEMGGSGVIVLPCGAGKTIVGMAAMALVQTRTLILSPNITAARQWIREILDKTDLTEDDVCEYSGEKKKIGPVTIATYQVLTRKRKKDDKETDYAHFDLFNQNKWGLIVYDEVHLLPAPVFRLCAEMQATRRLGLTATLVREDGKETEVFSLIGPKKYDLPWKTLEGQGWIAKATCSEIRIPLNNDEKMRYAMAEPRDKIKIASCSPSKTLTINELLIEHSDADDRILIIGQYIDQLETLAEELQVPLITGKTPNAQRDEIYQRFRTGEITKLIVSKVANFAIDLPDANVLIQISGTFGSRQEEAQRLGRVLRPKSTNVQAYFYSLISQDTREQEFAMNRQLFLAEQGYTYHIKYADQN